jgi:tRNA/rRNA methyltransferase
MAVNPVASRLVVVLVATRNPLNIGAAARAMTNFGFKDLRVVNPYPVAFRNAKSAVGASSVLKAAKEYKSVAEAVAGCSLVVGTTAARNRRLDHDLRLLHEGAIVIRKKLRTGSVALLFGSEKRGLSNHDLSYCHWLMRIPTLDGQPSMNLGQAVAVCLHELIRPSRLAATSVNRDAASSAEIDRLMAVLLDVLVSSGYLKAEPSSLTQEKIRRLVRRLNLSAEDAELWLGIFRQIRWKIPTDN